MIALLQRVESASVRIAGRTESQISEGLLIFLGIYSTDTELDATRLAHKSAHLRVFDSKVDSTQKSVIELHKEVLVVSQFTLCASTKRGRRPSFSAAAISSVAQPLYTYFTRSLKHILGEELVREGVFSAQMDISLLNTGPYTLIIHS